MSAVNATQQPKTGSKKGNPQHRSRSSGGSSERNKTPPQVRITRAKDEHGRKDKGDDQREDPQVYEEQNKIARGE